MVAASRRFEVDLIRDGGNTLAKWVNLGIMQLRKVRSTLHLARMVQSEVHRAICQGHPDNCAQASRSTEGRIHRYRQHGAGSSTEESREGEPAHIGIPKKC